MAGLNYPFYSYIEGLKDDLSDALIYWVTSNKLMIVQNGLTKGEEGISYLRVSPYPGAILNPVTNQELIKYLEKKRKILQLIK